MCGQTAPTARFFSNISRRPSHWEDAGFSTFIQGTLSRSVTGRSLRAGPDNKEVAGPPEGETRPLNLGPPAYLIRYVRTRSTFDDSIFKPCFEARTLMKPLTEWPCQPNAFINSGNVAPPARDNIFTTSSRTAAAAFEAFRGFEVLGWFRLRAALGFRATLLAAGSGLRTAQIRVYRPIARFLSWSYTNFAQTGALRSDHPAGPAADRPVEGQHP